MSHDRMTATPQRIAGEYQILNNNSCGQSLVSGLYMLFSASRVEQLEVRHTHYLIHLYCVFISTGSAVITITIHHQCLTNIHELRQAAGVHHRAPSCQASASGAPFTGAPHRGYLPPNAAYSSVSTSTYTPPIENSARKTITLVFHSRRQSSSI